MSDLTSHRLGTVTLVPAGPVVAGSVGQWTLIYTVGSYGIDEGGTIMLAQRLVSDWQTPQFDRPTEPGYTTVTTTGAARLAVRYDPKAYKRPWSRCLVIDVFDGSLAPGDIVTIALGDQNQGSPGIRAQTFRESAHEFRLLVDPTNACVPRRVPSSPVFPIVTGEAVELVCIVPTQAVVGQPVEVFVKGQDRWGNPTPAPDDVTLRWEGEGATAIAGDVLTPTAPGSGVVRASGSGMTCCSNPMTIFEAESGLKKFWGDLHAQTAATVGTGTEEEYFTFGRDVARLDFISHQGNDFQMTDEYWQRLNEAVRAFHEDGRFVVFPGYEWSANTPAGGDRNVFYLEEDQPIFRSSHWQITQTAEDDKSPAHPADVLFKRLKQHVAPDRVLVAAHVGGRYADIRRYFDPDLCSLVEVASCWGVFEWLLWDAFEKGYVVGVMCNSDGHKGRPGAEAPGAGEFGIAGGLTCVLAEDLTREAVFRALKARRCYGTTGPRIDLSFTVSGHAMGSVVNTRERIVVEASVRCTAPLESLILYRGKEPLEVVRPAAFSSCAESKRIRVRWGGARIRGRNRRVTWDGSIRVTGARIVSATTFAFDAVTDGMTSQDEHEVAFRSRTTGDTDGVDLVLDQAGVGSLVFDSSVGCCEVDLSRLGAADDRKVFDLGGVGMQVCVERYPETLTEYQASLCCTVIPPPGQVTPYFVKVVQCDGHMAWSSPVYLHLDAGGSKRL